MPNKAMPLDWPPPDSAGTELKCFRREDPFKRGAALSLSQAEELQHRRRMLGQLLKMVLDQSVGDEIAFRSRDGYVIVEGTHPLDRLNTPAILQEIFGDLAEFLHASEVLAALANVADAEASGKGEDAAHAAEVLKRLAKKRTVKGAPLAGVFYDWMSRNARACVQELDIAVMGQLFNLRIPSKNRIAAHSLVASVATQRVLESIDRTSATHDVYVITTVDGRMIVLPKSFARVGPDHGATFRIRADDLRRSRPVTIYRWKSRPQAGSDSEEGER